MGSANAPGESRLSLAVRSDGDLPTDFKEATNKPLTAVAWRPMSKTPDEPKDDFP
jgi:hypothetical protein